MRERGQGLCFMVFGHVVVQLPQNKVCAPSLPRAFEWCQKHSQKPYGFLDLNISNK